MKLLVGKGANTLKSKTLVLFKHRIPFTYCFVKPLPVLVPEVNSKGPVQGCLEGAAGTLHAGWTQAGEAEGAQHWGHWCHGANLAEQGELHTPVAHEQALGLLQLQAEPGAQPVLETGGAEFALQLH